MTSSELEKKLRAFHTTPFHAENFERRHEYDLVVYMDQHSSTPGQTPQLTHLVKAILDFELTKVQ